MFKNMEEAIEAAGRARRDGFDQSEAWEEESGVLGVSIRCSQCQALVVNGRPIHEAGCPKTRLGGKTHRPGLGAFHEDEEPDDDLDEDDDDAAAEEDEDDEADDEAAVSEEEDDEDEEVVRVYEDDDDDLLTGDADDEN